MDVYRAPAAPSLSAGSGSSNEGTREYSLGPRQEFRIEVAHGRSLTLTIARGTAEVFGSELPLNVEHTFTDGQKLAVFTWTGCHLRVQGESELEYTSDDTPMASYLNTHLALERERIQRIEQTSKSAGPRVLIVGSEASGKSTLARILINYAVRNRSRGPIYVDLDPSSSHILPPGQLSAIQVFQTRIPPPDQGGFAALPLLTTTDGGSKLSPISVFYGPDNVMDNPILFNNATSTLSDVVWQRLTRNKPAHESGLIIDTSSKTSEQMIEHIVNVFKVDVILVVGMDRLYAKLNKVPWKPPFVIKLSKSGGVADRDEAWLERDKFRSIKRYFYGIPPTMDLAPHSITIKFNEFSLLRYGIDPLLADIAAPLSALPAGTKNDKLADAAKITIAVPSQMIAHTLLYVIGAESAQLIRESALAGIVYVTSVDEINKRITLLSPSPGKPPFRNMIIGDQHWIDT
ncbi:hypothetical protein GQ42DRAFT_128665 [Ramicandelaber brevisporus]|nr:hypothetical protein GQ42DRAFT_128665 [Ramicandelaber brevisporus]